MNVPRVVMASMVFALLSTSLAKPIRAQENGTTGTHARTLVPGEWAMWLGPMRYVVRVETGAAGEAPRLTILDEGEEIEARKVAFENGILGFTIGPKSDELTLRCTLKGKPDGSYAGTCVFPDGRGGTIRLIPPR